MRVVTTRAEVRQAHADLGAWALVPTMGFLHEGHLELVRRARAGHGRVVVSIFVNPTQFGPDEDLSTYPRDLDRDLELLRGAGADVVWVPTVQDVYPSGSATTVRVGETSEGVALTGLLEGACRPGHFDGVATVVATLIGVTQPVALYLGQKDVQQTVVLQRMVTDLGLPVEVVVCPTVREPDGLAMSSRNSYLDADERAGATVLVRALRAAEASWAEGVRGGDELRAAMTQVLSEDPRASVDYVSIADPVTLTELAQVDSRTGAIASLAVRIGRTRLIDNVLLPPH